MNDQYPPPLVFALRPSLFWAFVVGFAWLCSAGAVAGFAALSPTLGFRHGILAIGCLASGCLAAVALRQHMGSVGHGELAYNEGQWHLKVKPMQSWGSKAPSHTGATELLGQLTVMMDWQTHLLVTFQHKEKQWLWLDSSSNPSQWLALRRAAFAQQIQYPGYPREALPLV